MENELKSHKKLKVSFCRRNCEKRTGFLKFIALSFFSGSKVKIFRCERIKFCISFFIRKFCKKYVYTIYVSCAFIYKCIYIHTVAKFVESRDKLRDVFEIPFVRARYLARNCNNSFDSRSKQVPKEARAR